MELREGIEGGIGTVKATIAAFKALGRALYESGKAMKEFEKEFEKIVIILNEKENQNGRRKNMGFGINNNE